MFKRISLDQLALDHLDDEEKSRLQRAIAQANIWIDRKHKRGELNASLIIHSHTIGGGRTGSGVGKTHIAKALLHTECYHIDEEIIAPTGEYTTANRLLHALTPRIDAGDLLWGATTLVIEEVGQEQRIQYMPNGEEARERRGRYTRLIDYCAHEAHPVSIIATTNLVPAALAQWIGHSAWSKLYQMCGGKRGLVNLSGLPDYRQRKVVL